MSNKAANGRANMANPTYAALTSVVDGFISGGYTSPTADYGRGSDDYSHFANAAIRWQADGDPKSLAAAIYGLQHVENMVGGSTYCNTSGQYCNNAYQGTLNFVSLFTVSVAQAYSIVRNQLSPADRAMIASKFLNDNDLAHNGLDTVSCANRQGAWTTGSCGIIWLVKHDNSAPPIVPGQESHYNKDYPNGNSFVYPGGNLTYTALVAYIAVGLAFADDDPRAVLLLQQAYNYYIANQYTYARSSWTGYTQAGALYSPWRLHWFSSIIAIMMKNSVNKGPDLTQGNYVSKQVPFYYYNALPDAPTEGLTFEDIYGSAWDQFGLRSLWPAMWLYSSKPEAGYANYYARTVRGDFNQGGLAYNQGAYLPYSYTFTDPAQPSTNLSGAPTQYLFRATDYSLCPGLGLNCTANMGYTHAVSRTGWSTNDSLMLIQGGYNDGSDHSGFGDWGSVHIYRRGYLLAGDAEYSNNNRDSDNTIELGNGDNWVAPGKPGYTNIVRWAGADPSGDAQSRYAFALVDMTGAYASSQNATRVQRHILHFKKASQQDYIVWYDDVATSSGGMKKAYLHYALNGTASGQAISFNGGNNGGTVMNTQSKSRLVTAVLPTAGGNTALLKNDSSSGTYSGGAGYTYRAYVCAENSSSPGSCSNSATAGEWIVVHKPSTNTSDTMPTLSQPLSTNFRVVEIKDGSAPKVAAFATGGQTYTTASFSTTHPGTAQYVIDGLSAGSYQVTVNGATVASNQSVANGDNTLYFESTSGSIVVSQGGSGSFSACDLNRDGATNNSDVSLELGHATGSAGACTAAFDLNQDGVCNVVDLQRVINASLGQSCMVTP
jgi:hypothetical protein